MSPSMVILIVFNILLLVLILWSAKIPMKSWAGFVALLFFYHVLALGLIFRWIPLAIFKK